MDTPWLDDAGLIALPSGPRIRGRRLTADATPADFTLVLAKGPRPEWEHRVIQWPDFGTPKQLDDALDALHEAHRRALAGERVEAACHGGMGRTGTALAAIGILDGLTPDEAFAWVRREYHPKAIETPGQRRWLEKVR